MSSMAFSRFFVAVLGVLLGVVPAWATDYHVGPNARYTAVGDVPWFRLAPGDTVFIHYKPTPYFEKVLISTRGTPERWIRVIGVPGPDGQLPVISGNNATTSRNMHYHWPAASGSSAIQNLGVVQVAAGAGENAPLPGYIEIANLQIQDGFSGHRFTAEDGSRAAFDSFAACIYARSVQNLIVRNNVLTGCGQGFYNWTGSGERVVGRAADRHRDSRQLLPRQRRAGQLPGTSELHRVARRRLRIQSLRRDARRGARQPTEGPLGGHRHSLQLHPTSAVRLDAGPGRARERVCGARRIARLPTHVRIWQRDDK